MLPGGRREPRPDVGNTAAPSSLAGPRARRTREGPHRVYLEAFTAPKDPTSPHDNEDRIVAYDGRTFAVVDGVTDKSGARYDGRTGGAHAGRALERALRGLTDDGSLAQADTEFVTERLNAAIREAYARFDLLEAAAADPGLRFGATAAVAHLDGGSLRLLVVGDCGARADGRVWQRPNPADDVVAALRGTAYAVLTEAAPTLALHDRLALARAYTVAGIGSSLPESPLDPPGHAALAARVHATLAAEFPRLDEHLRTTLADGGLRAAARLRAGGVHTDSAGPGVLRHGVLDGFDLEVGAVDDVRLDVDAVGVLELFSDGYFGWPTPGGTVAAWEAHRARVEREDPHRLGRYRSTKGSSPGRNADDRTIVILRKEPPTHEAA